MNYRHAFHAGNFADVVKHAVLARIVDYLQRKETPIRFLDTHAGSGLYDLRSAEAERGGEWQAGIGRLLDAANRRLPLAPDLHDLLSPYLDAVRRFNPADQFTTYPGSPALLRFWLRGDDRLTACELEASAHAALEDALRGDARCKAIRIDGWTALSAYIPPKERRGLVLIDPPFEQQGEYARLATALGAAWRKWPTGLYLAWYPVKDPKDLDLFMTALAQQGIGKMLRAEASLAPATETTRLRGTGLIVINPPWTLREEMDVLLPALAGLFAPGRGEALVAPLSP
jgi:23S rRNA (adenine2030-N6)-methyltransferase